jgi:glucose-6-phosphate dehydrogenase assembly protein OpcA
VTPAVQTVKPDAVLHELSELWGKVLKPEPEPGHGNGADSLRACAMTLIVFVDDEDDAAALDETLKAVMHVHPSRAIVVRLREEPGTLSSRVLVQCWLPVGHHRKICCEQIELSVSMNRLDDLPTIIDPLTAADMPRVIWFRSARIEGAPDVAALLKLADKVVVDSTRHGAPAFADMRVLAGAGYIVADLAWTRLTRIRQLLAQLLNGHDLANIRGATIHYSGADPSPAAKYIQAWLRSEMAAAAVDLRKDGAQGRGEITAIQIDPDINVRVSSDCAEYETGALRQRANLTNCAEEELLSEELSIMSHDPAFERALQRMTIWTPRS